VFDFESGRFKTPVFSDEQTIWHFWHLDDSHTYHGL